MRRYVTFLISTLRSIWLSSTTTFEAVSSWLEIDAHTSHFSLLLHYQYVPNIMATIVAADLFLVFVILDS